MYKYFCLSTPNATFYEVTYFISLDKKYYFWHFCLKQRILYLNFIICKVWYP